MIKKFLVFFCVLFILNFLTSSFLFFMKFLIKTFLYIKITFFLLRIIYHIFHFLSTPPLIILQLYKKINTYKADSGMIYSAPLVVLVDKNSASASEILAGALKDNNRAKLIGGATFGKGLVQKVYSLPNSTGINLTVARYLTPKGSQIDKIGIKPDFEVQFTKEDLIEALRRIGEMVK